MKSCKKYVVFTWKITMRTGPWYNIKVSCYQYRIVGITCYYYHLISTMGFSILVKWHHYIESGPRITILHRWWQLSCQWLVHSSYKCPVIRKIFHVMISLWNIVFNLCLQHFENETPSVISSQPAKLLLNLDDTGIQGEMLILLLCLDP